MPQTTPRPATSTSPPADARTADTFEQRLERLVARAEEQRAEDFRDQEAEMERRVQLQTEFEQLADQLHRHEIRPRIEAVARRFEHARLEHLKTPAGTLSVCALPRTDRFPASTTLTVGVTFDADRVAASITYRLQIIPVLMEFDAEDALGVALEAPAVEEVAGWLERRLEQFVETYLRLEREPAYRRGTEHIDPVCGMRVSAGSAVRLDRNGHALYFCAPACCARFQANPDAYAGAGHCRA